MQQNAYAVNSIQNENDEQSLNKNKININSQSVPILKNYKQVNKNNIIINEPVKEQEGGNMEHLKQQIMKILS